MKTYDIYTDGSSADNFNIGGWGCVVLENKKLSIPKFEFNGFIEKNNDYDVNSNTAEMLAAINSISLLPKNSNINIYTDSSYLKWGFHRGIEIWPKNNWVSKNNYPITSRKLWEKLIQIKKKYQNIQIHWVKGHDSDYNNIRADRLAYLARNKKIIDNKEQSSLYEVFVNVSFEMNEFVSRVVFISNKDNFEIKIKNKELDFLSFCKNVHEIIVAKLNNKNFNFATIYSKSKNFEKLCSKNNSLDFQSLNDNKINPEIMERYKSIFS